MATTPLIKHTWTTSIKNDTGTNVISDSQVITGSDEANFKVTVTAGTTAEIDCGTIPVAAMVSLFFESNVAVTVNTNSADGSFGQTIALAAAQGFTWNNTLPHVNPVTSDITKIFVTNAGNKDATFVAGFLLNQIIA